MKTGDYTEKCPMSRPDPKFSRIMWVAFCFVVITVGLCMCSLFIREKPPSVWSHARTFCEWIDNDLYYVPPNQNKLVKFNIPTGNTDTLCDLGMYFEYEATTALEYSAVDSCLYYVMIPMGQAFWTGFYGVTIFGIWQGYDAYYDYLRESLQNSRIFKYDIIEKKRTFLHEIHGESESIHIGPSGDFLMINAVIWDTFTVNDRDSQQVFGFQMDSTIIYLYDTDKNLCDTLSTYIGKGYWAIGFLPDSNLLVVKADCDTYHLFSTGDDWELKFSGKIDSKSHGIKDFRSLKLLSGSSIITWFDWHQQIIHLYDINSGESDTLSALCNSYCFSPDGSKIAYFIYHSYPRRVMIRILPIKTNLLRS
jgi:hypothetical protein